MTRRQRRLEPLDPEVVHDRPIAGLGAPDAPHVEDVETPADAVDYVEASVD